MAESLLLKWGTLKGWELERDETKAILTRIHGNISFECDDCSEVLDTETRDFNEAMNKLREEEWRSQKRGQDWSHYCPMCWTAREDREDNR